MKRLYNFNLWSCDLDNGETRKIKRFIGNTKNTNTRILKRNWYTFATTKGVISLLISINELIVTATIEEFDELNEKKIVFLERSFELVSSLCFYPLEQT